MHVKECPQCGTTWESNETIFEFFLKKYENKEEALSAAKNYGCTPEAPKHFSKNVIGVEIQGMYDGVSFWECQECKTTFNRWTMKAQRI